MKRIFTTLSVTATLLMAFLTTSPVLALAAPAPGIAPFSPYVALQSQVDACAGLTALDSTQGCGSGDSSVNKIIKTVVSTLSVIVGILAVIMVVIAGFKYVTSRGDSSSVASAKNTLIYALVGVIVAALAQAIVHFAFNAAVKK